MSKNYTFCIIIEDEPLAQEVLENYVSRTDNLKLVAKCETIREAFGILRSSTVDIIFLDIDLKLENGMDVIRKAENLANNRYFVIITSAVSPKDLNSDAFFSDTNFTLIDHLTKPFSYERFLESIYRVIQRRSQDNS